MCVVQHDLVVGWKRAGRVRIDGVAEPGEVVAAGSRVGQVGDGTAVKRGGMAHGRVDVPFEQLGGRDAVDVEKDQQVGRRRTGSEIPRFRDR